MLLSVDQKLNWIQNLLPVIPHLPGFFSAKSLYQTNFLTFLIITQRLKDLSQRQLEMSNQPTDICWCCSVVSVIYSHRLWMGWNYLREFRALHHVSCVSQKLRKTLMKEQNFWHINACLSQSGCSEAASTSQWNCALQQVYKPRISLWLNLILQENGGKNWLWLLRHIDFFPPDFGSDYFSSSSKFSSATALPGLATWLCPTNSWYVSSF